MAQSGSEIQSLGVIGAGTMGAGIAQTAVLAGIVTTLVDVDEGQLERPKRRSAPTRPADVARPDRHDTA